MSAIDSQQSQLGQAAASSTVISIPERDRTQQSETRHSLGEGGSCAVGNSGRLTPHLLVQGQLTDRDGSALNGSHDKENLSPGTRFIGRQNNEVEQRDAIFTDSVRSKGKTQIKTQKEATEINGSLTDNVKNAAQSEGQHSSVIKDPTTSNLPEGFNGSSASTSVFYSVSDKDTCKSGDTSDKDTRKSGDTSDKDTRKSGDTSDKDTCKSGDTNIQDLKVKTDLSDDSQRDTNLICQDSEGGSSRDPTSSPNRPGKLGMLPNTNWKRVRNTLKAASEMQGPKKHKHTLDREDSFLRKFSTRNHQDIQNSPNSFDDEDHRSNESPNSYEGRFVIQHDGTFMFYWLGVITLAVLYNIWTCIARQAFTEIQQGCPPCWYTFDGLVDFLYVCDILVQFRTGYLDQGLLVYDARKLFVRYARSKCIYVDFLCLLPLDLIQLVIGVHPMIRFPRFFKVYRTFRFVYMLESRTNYPNLFRVANLTHLVLLGAHWFAAFYYMISEAEKFTGNWSYPKPVGEYADITRKYLQCLHWAVLTLTTIGDLPIPDNPNQYVFTIGSYLIGVFVFATIVGQVGNVINNRNASRIEFERLLDGAKVYMQTHNVPHNLQKRVQRWYDYVWSRGRLNGCDINSLGLLPDKLKTELAIHVNLETLRKVTIFQECQPEFLHDLVLKMKAYIFTPGDLICRRGEVAREMFIIADGVVEIISETGVMLKRMGAGDFFGEIGILNLDGGINRRTADVRSVGYLELFVLSREDVLEALKDHPDAETVIREYGHRRLREVEAHRHKVKPFVNDSFKEQSPNSSGAAPIVQNRLLYTLKTLNSAMRRQSSLATIKAVSPPAVASSDVQRCVTFRESPAKSLANPSCNTDSGLSIVSVDKPVYSTGILSSRFSESSRQRRKGLGYLQAAFAKFRKTFNRRKDKRRDLNISDSPRRKSTENRLLLKPVDDHAVTVDLSTYPSSYTPGRQVTVNIEDCPRRDLVANDSDMSRDKDLNIRSANRLETNTSIHPVADLNPLLEFTLMTPSISGLVLERSTDRKYSHPVSYTSVSTEDLDDKKSSRNQSKGDANAAESRPQIILDVGKIHSIFGRERIFSDSFSNCATSGRIRSSSVSNSNSLALNTSNGIPNSSLKQSGNLDESLHVRTTADSKLEHPCTFSPIEQTASSLLPESGFNDSDSFGKFSTRSLFVSPKKSVHFSPKHKNGDRYALASTQQDTRSRQCGFANRTQTPDKASPRTSSTECAFKTETIDANQASGNTRCLLSGSPVQCVPSRQLPSCDDFQKPSNSHQSDSLLPCLVNSNSESDADIRNMSASRHHSNPKVRSLSNSDAPSKSTSLSSGRVTPSGRTSSFPALSGLPSHLDMAREDISRPTSLDTSDQYIIDELADGFSPTYGRVPQNGSPTVKRDGSNKSGRSQPMSIIQQLTSDITYQQLVSVISTMQEAIDKRLTHLEEVFVSTSAQLDRLAASQDALLQLFSQQSDKRHAHFSVETQEADDINYRL